MSKTKDQFIEKTGGFRIFENSEEFKNRMKEIDILENKENLTEEDLDRLAELKE